MRAFYFLLVIPVLAGCGGPYKTASVSGRVMLNGKPFANAAVLFQPVATSGPDAAGPGSTGVTNEEGRYTLTLVGGGKGAVVGKHKVWITRVNQETDSEDDRPKLVSRLPKQVKPSKDLDFEVPPGGTDAADFNLTSP